MTTLKLDNIDLGSFGATDKPKEVTEIVDQQQSRGLNTTFSEAFKVSPDEHAKNLKLSRQSGVPAEAVASDPKVIETDLKLQNINFDQLSKRSPNTSKYLVDFNNAVIAQDDVQVLEGIESVLRALPSGFLQQFGGAFEGAGRTIEAGGRTLARGFDAILPESADRFIFDQEDSPPLLKTINRLAPANAFRWEGQGLKSSAEAIGPDAENQNIATDISAGIGQVTGQILTYLASAPVGVASLFSQGVDQQGERQEASGTEGQDMTSDLALFTGGAITAVSERTGIDKLLDRVPPSIKNAVARQIADLAIAGGMEAVQEVIEGVGQGLLEQYTTNPDAEPLEGLSREAIAAGGTGAIVRGIVNALTPGRFAALDQHIEHQQAKSEAEQMTIDDLNVLAEQSKLKGRDLESFAQAVNAADGDKNTRVFIDGAQLSLYLKDKDIKSDIALQLLAGGIDTSASVGTDVSINVGDFATYIAGTPHFDALREFMTMSGDTVAPFRQEESQNETRQYIETMMNDAQQNASQYVESQEIFNTVRDQLVDTGMVTQANAGIMADIVPAWAAVYARKNGITVAEAYQRSGLMIEGPQSGKLSALSDQALGTVEAPVIDPIQMEERLAPKPDRRAPDAPATESERRADDRRRDTDRRAKLEAMTPEERYAAIYLNELTGLNNRRAFEEDLPDAPVVVSVDVDSLKTVNDNLGHDAGDQLLKVAGKAIHDATGGKAYHVSGDEFYVLGDDAQLIEQQLAAAKEALSTAVVASEKGTLTGVDFTFGVADSKAAADSKMEAAKHEREARGERVPRGELPRGLTLNKPEQFNQEARGYYDPANSVIRLTEAADLSTFLHEFAHFMYEMELKADGDTKQVIHEWFRRNAGDVAKEAHGYLETFDKSIIEQDVTAYLDNGTTGSKAKDSAIRRATHEQFARGWETYLMEGKAPSTELRNVFRTFARWLTDIYKAVRGNLNVNLDDQMRRVFDALIATDEQMAAAEARAQYAPMFTDAAMAGMTEEEFAKYRDQEQKVKGKEAETLREQLIKQITRETKSWWKEEKADFIDEAMVNLRNEPVYRAAESLRGDKIKLDLATVKELVGEERTDKLGRKSIRPPTALKGMTVGGAKGVHPDEAAAFFGFNSGDEMLDALIAAPPIKAAAETAAEEAMKAKHGDMLNDGTIEQQADEALQNEERGELLLAELKALTRGRRMPTLDRATIKALAEENIAKLSFKEIHPAKYRKAEIRAAQEAATAMAAGNTEQAAQAKGRQLLNFYLGMAATDAKNGTTKIVDRMARYNKKSVREEIMKAENGYMEQIDKILRRFEFRKSATLKQVDQVNQDINSWVKDRTEQDGDALVLHPAVLDETFVTHWKNVPYGELQGVNDSVKNIEHVARYSNKLTRMGEEMEFKKLVQRWTDHMQEVQPNRFKSQRSTVVEGRNWGRWAMGQMTKIPFLASWLDGGERTGLSHQILVQPFTDAADAEANLWKEVGNKVLTALEGRSKQDMKRHNRKIYIPEIKDENNDGNLFGHQVLAVALNTGNQGNLRKMLLGEGWANPQDDAEITIDNPKLQAVLANMSKSDWELVQLIWDQMDTLYPQLSEVHRRTTGLVPPKVTASPVVTQHGTFNGGYYPVKYDPNRSFKAEQNEERLNAQTESMFGTIGSIQASVNASATNERTKYYAPMRLSLDVVPDHFQETIHYITHHDAVREVNKLIRNKEVAETIKAKLGPEEFAQLKPWLNDIAKDGRELQNKFLLDPVFKRLRFGLTLGIMGFKASTGIIQISGLSNTVAEVGLGPVLQSARTILGSPATMRSAWDFASNNSKVLNHRSKTFDREIKNAMQKLQGKKGVLAAVQETSMKHIALIQTYMVDLPSWHAAYTKSLVEHGDEQRAYQYADWVVENVQGSGMTKDMPAFMRNQSDTHRTFTMFMTFFSSLWNMERDLVKGAKSGRYSVTTIAAKAAFLFTVPVIFEMLMRGELGGEDDDESDMQKILTKTAIFPVQSVPFLRDVVNGSVGEFGYNISPVASLMEQATQSVPALVERGFTDEEITKGQAKNASKFAGVVAGLPGTSQAWATGEHIYQVMEEGEELTIRELLFGPSRD